ncbi:MAG: hypothetical protein F4Y00_02010 [Bacteroidetes bacterium SB0662_bin_6]|nr:hypothetical protein [Bacteroidetes bacterium SB0662_bin_6]
MRHPARTLRKKRLRADSCRALSLCMAVVLGWMGWTAASVPAAAQQASSLFADLGTDAVTLAPSPLSKTGEPAWVTEPIPAEATGFVVQGTTSDRNLTGWVRFENGPWRALRVVFSATGDTFFAGFHGDDVFTAGRFEIRFETRAAVRLAAAGVFDNRQDADRGEAVEKREGERGDQGEAPPEETGEVRLQKSGIILPPFMYDRKAWNADPFRGNPVALARPNYRNMAFHHAAGFWATTHEEGLEQLKAIQNLHQNIRGWSDIGYHFVLDQSGRLYQGRPFLRGDASLDSVPPLAMGAHVGGHNTGNIGVCMLGCYHPPYIARCIDTLAPPTFDSLAVTFSFLSESYGVSPDNLRGHGQFPGAATSCPGENNLAIFDDLVERIRTLLVTGNAPLGRAALAVRSDEDGVVHLSWEFLDAGNIAGYRIERVEGPASVVIFEGDQLHPGDFTDGGATWSGQISYRLYGRSASGREQLLATVAATLERPERHVLTENYPEPFFHTSTIRYYLPRDGIVHLTVFDALGRSVANLAEGAAESEGWHHIPFDATRLPSGTYFYRLRIEGFSGTAYDQTHSLVRIR